MCNCFMSCVVFNGKSIIVLIKQKFINVVLKIIHIIINGVLALKIKYHIN